MMSDSRQAAWAARKPARGASRSCNPETEFTAGHASRDADVAALRAELKEAAAGWAANGVLVGEAQAERDAALAVIADAAAWIPDEPTFEAPESNERALGSVRSALAKVPAEALAEHDRAVVKAALHGFADRLRSEYCLDHSSPAALLEQIVGLARRDGGAG